MRRLRAISALVAGAALLLAQSPAALPQALGRGGPQGGAGAACEPLAAEPYAEVDIETRPRVSVEVARTPAERSQGLMFRQALEWERGMVFVFESRGQSGFWMRNTYVPLSIAWIEADGTIVDIQDMQPLDETVHTPVAPYVYALEVNQGWFFANGVGVGQRVTLCLGPEPSAAG